ncbi:nucleotidyltransferase family protein [Desulfurococcus mucosus]|uniref:Nucleotidyl transferase n=1 Tax=Desulfurococcus mucosus (strain ATCC 35584 / DSM 2162 / JCM 9187 / O7/1) TaxID=765177 RepID=E8RAK2_DESM0|nr:nucleotidyltransferase family protein [Desulfurococcus mucosus]ADV65438.1 Nucleotidyl transferase [Desulfurococcus mucosus DSM 2162]
MLAVILAGGYGKRLRPFTEDTPKPMVPVGDRPILEWQIEWLKRYGFNEFVLLVGYKKEKIIEHIGSGSRLGVRVTYVVEDEPLGTGGAVKNAEHVLSRDNAFLVVNGDIITNLNPLRLFEKLEKAGYLGVIASIPLPSPYGVLEIEGDDKVKGFIEKPQLSDYWINAGVYALTPDALKYFPERGDLEKTAFPAMAREGRLGTVRYTGVFWKAIDTFKELEEASKAIHEIFK